MKKGNGEIHKMLEWAFGRGVDEWLYRLQRDQIGSNNLLNLLEVLENVLSDAAK